MMTSPQLRKPPQAIEAEQSIIGGLLLDNEPFDEVYGIVQESDFYVELHRRIFAEIATFLNRKEPVDAVIILEKLKKNNTKNEYDQIKKYIIDLVENTPGTANIEFYSKLVYEKSKLRKLIKSCNESIHDAFDSNKDTAEIIDSAETRILELVEDETVSGFKDIDEMINQCITLIDERFNSESNLIGIPTGFEELDNITSGLNDGDLIVVGGRPSMGKSTFALNIAENLISKDEAVGVFSLEMPSEQLMNRMISSIGHIPLQNVRTGKLETQDFHNLNKAVGILNGKDLFVDDRSGITVNEIRASARRMDKKARSRQEAAGRQVNGLSMIVVDYLQLIANTSFRENITAQVTDTINKLQALARELKIPIIVLSQLNRDLVRRQDKRPTMADLRESGAIEQAADLILFIYRDEVYDPDSEDAGTAEIIIGKQRNGPLGTVKLAFMGEYSKFTDTKIFQEDVY